MKVAPTKPRCQRDNQRDVQDPNTTRLQGGYVAANKCQPQLAGPRPSPTPASARPSSTVSPSTARSSRPAPTPTGSPPPEPERRNRPRPADPRTSHQPGAGSWPSPQAPTLSRSVPYSQS